MTDTSPLCPLCQGRGFIIDAKKQQKKCVCQVKKELEMFLAPVIQYQLVKTTDFSSLDNHLLIARGSPAGFGSLVKSYLFHYYFSHSQSYARQYELCTGNTIMEAYLSPEKTHTRFYTLPLLFLDLTSYYSNRAMGEVLVYILEQRVAHRLPFWIYIGYMQKEDIDRVYNGGLKNFLSKLTKINIDSYTNSLTEEF